MTEDQAKTKTCVQTLAPFRDPLGGHTYGHAICIASKCMAWRWSEDLGFEMAANLAFQRDGTRLKPTEGHCGLAGQP